MNQNELVISFRLQDVYLLVWLFHGLLPLEKETGKWGEKNRAEVVKLTIPHLKIDEDILTTMVERRTYGLRPITPEIMQNQQKIADLFAKEKVIPKSINIKEAMLTSEQYAAITPETISQK
jgi:sulfonate transport system substrate-binding protein